MPEKLRKRPFGARESPPLLSDEPTDTSLSTPTATGTGQEGQSYVLMRGSKTPAYRVFTTASL